VSKLAATVVVVTYDLSPRRLTHDVSSNTVSG